MNQLLPVVLVDLVLLADFEPLEVLEYLVALGYL
jgi:hypothetical protein